MANALIKKYRVRKDIKLIENAESLLKDNCSELESPYMKAKRWNNIGLCELFRKHYANSFKYFAKAFEAYREDRDLNILGVIMNISRVYR